MKKITGEICPVCNQPYSPVNCKTRHHICPKRFFGGGGGLYTLCRLCHNELELLIPYSKKLPKIKYLDILKNFIKKKGGNYDTCKTFS